MDLKFADYNTDQGVVSGVESLGNRLASGPYYDTCRRDRRSGGLRDTVFRHVHTHSHLP